MKIEIFVVDNINEKCTGMTCFEAKEYIWNMLEHHKTVKGIVVINDEAIKFSFSPYFRDGDIFSNNQAYIDIIKHLIPVYFASLIRMGNKTHLKTYAQTKNTGE